jgi:N-methylhydantoinase A
MTLLGIDTGGTFTDFVSVSNGRWRVHKVLSTPEQPQQAILKGIEDLGLTSKVKTGQVILIHGTTVATNATLENKGVRTAYITNQGLKDVLIIGRQTRPELYNLTPIPTGVPADPELSVEVTARISANGKVISSLGKPEIEALIERISALEPTAIAINLLFSFKNPKHEIEIESHFSDRYFVSRSSDILPEHKEFERGVATWINAWLGPLIRNYLTALSNALAPAQISIMQSSGLTISADQAANRAVNLLLSGPAGGLAAAQYVGTQTNKTQLLTFDMGGTSTDVALIKDRFKLTNTGHIAGMPIAVPMADIHTIGAGGGSIAFLDSGGLLRVGPRSAGAFPGPACYDRGGDQPTVTDANLVLGRLSPDRTLADGLRLSREKAEVAIATIARPLGQSVEEVAHGIVAVANEHMVQALRVISVERGHDPREFTLMCFGGAGGLHLCDLAESLQMNAAMVPRHGGVLSALGMLTTTPGRELVQTIQTPVADLNEETLMQALDELASRGVAELKRESVQKINRSDSLDLRYEGQTFTLNLPIQQDLDALTESFHLAHERQFGHRLPRAVEILNGRVHLEADQQPPELEQIAELNNSLERTNSLERKDSLERTNSLERRDITEHNKSNQSSNTINRDSLGAGTTGRGPILIVEAHSSTYVKNGWHYTVDKYGHLHLDRNRTTAQTKT